MTPRVEIHDGRPWIVVDRGPFAWDDAEHGERLAAEWAAALETIAADRGTSNPRGS